MINEIEKKDSELFNRIASNYAQKDVWPSSYYARKYQLLHAIAHFIDEKKNLGVILDVGCGSGAASRYLKGKYSWYTGVDHSHELIKYAKQISKDQENAEYIFSNIKTVSLPDQFADTILIVNALHHMTDYDIVFKKLRRIAKPGANLIMIEPQSENPFIQIARFIRGKVDSSYSSEQNFFKPNDLKKILEQNGVAEISLRNVYFTSVPFAEVILRPLFLSLPASRAAIVIDALFDQFLPSFLRFLSWNVVIYGKFVA